jgi:hypothetical protein
MTLEKLKEIKDLWEKLGNKEMVEILKEMIKIKESM